MTDLGRYVAEIFRSGFGLLDTLRDNDRDEILRAVMAELRSRAISLGNWLPTERVPTEAPR